MNDLNPFASPLNLETATAVEAAQVVELYDGIWQDNGILVMRKTAVLPNICIKTNALCNGPRLKRTLYWHHPAVYLGLLAWPIGGILLYLILVLTLRKKAIIWVPLAPERWRRRRVAIAISWSLLILALICLIGSPILADSTRNGHFMWGMLIGILLLLGSLIAGIVASKLITPKKIDDHFVWIKGVHPDYVASLPHFGR